MISYPYIKKVDCSIKFIDIWYYFYNIIL
jgi:hypothetical protein